MKLPRLLCTFGLIAAALPAFAADPVTLNLNVVKEQRIAAKDGTTTIKTVPLKSAVPGDTLVYTLSYRNTGKTPVADVVLDYPLPKGVAYRAAVGGSSVPDVSVDGKTFARLETLHIGGRLATAADVTHLRWTLKTPVAPGASGQVSFKAVLN
ncbi:hypothetical protein PQU92_05805 [Asticcacaulis sp. BYS171W]|uniref:DUF11 domain-containing protein n=1 Tax=Asticcacaulis aquaticus TaxID=2984212 RepID=A0ABT5HRT1_9CAUL|nr:hypothetical protein [Asticcacaulis aquaticus]MDC7682781.1 hypothetical protein [Asticcacaulis aquaticus]